MSASGKSSHVGNTEYILQVKSREESICVIYHVVMAETRLYFFSLLFGCLRPTVGHYQGDSLNQLMLILSFINCRSKVHWDPYSEAGSLSPPQCLVGIGPEPPILTQHLHQLGHSPQLINKGEIMIDGYKLEMKSICPFHGCSWLQQ